MSFDNTIRVQRGFFGKPSKGLLHFQGKVWPCLLGKNGIATRKLEGDMKTPSGTFPLLFGFFRKDRLARQPGLLVLKATKSDDGWCDAPSHPNYNRPVKLPFSASHEKMMRDDNLYDVVIVMDQNFSRRTRNRGSAVFFHLAGDKDHTAGCIGVTPKVMKFLLARINTKTRIVIKP